MRTWCSLTLLFVLSPSSPMLRAADKPNFPVPKPTIPSEPIAKTWNPQRAADYLDGVGVHWTRDRQCITCHTNMPYLMARPLLKGSQSEGWKEVRQFLEADVTKWQSGGKPRGDTYVVATATALVFNDQNTSGTLHPLTKVALDRMWTVQKSTGEWNWLKCNWPPLEHDDYYGAVLAAIAVGQAPGKYAESDSARAGLNKLKAYLSKTKAPDLHHRVHLLWAALKLEGLMTPAEKDAVLAELKQLQRSDGGWSLPSMGKYVRRDQTPNSADAESDGYGTGLAVYVLRQAGVPVSDPAISRGIAWLKSHQRESGRWYTRSLNNDKSHFITNAGSAFAVMALAACAEIERK
ncbi:MAG: hypothetical protein U0798_21120 [Gemmataceae bacterium]